MLSHPKPGDRVRLHYGKHYCDRMPYHGAKGTVEIPSKRRPRNHGVRLDSGELIVVPAGNLRKEN